MDPMMDPNAMQAQIAQLLANRDRQAMQLEVGAHDALGPEGFRQVLGQATMAQRAQLAAEESKANQAMVAQQLAQAQKYGQPQGKNYGHASANIVGGIGDMVRSGIGAYQSNKLMGQQKDLAAQGLAAQRGMLDKMDETNAMAQNARLAEMAKILAARQNPQAMPEQPQGPMAGGFGMPYSPYGG